MEDLFYNVATRRKALNNVAEEYNRVLDIVNRYAVHNTGVAFHLKKHGATVADVSTSSSSSQVDVIRTLYGGNVARELLPFEYTSPSLQFKASALLTNANFNVKKFTFLLFINQRAVDNPKLKRAIEAVYATYLPKVQVLKNIFFFFLQLVCVVGHPFVCLPRPQHCTSACGCKRAPNQARGPLSQRGCHHRPSVHEHPGKTAERKLVADVLHAGPPAWCGTTGCASYCVGIVGNVAAATTAIVCPRTRSHRQPNQEYRCICHP